MDSIRSCLDATLFLPGWGPCCPLCTTGVSGLAGGLSGMFTGLKVKTLFGLTLGETVGCSAGVGATAGATVGLAGSAACLFFCCKKDENDAQGQQRPPVTSRAVTEKPCPEDFLNLNKPRSSRASASTRFNIPLAHLTGSHGVYGGGDYDGFYGGGNSSGHGGCFDGGGDGGCAGGGGGCGGGGE